MCDVQKRSQQRGIKDYHDAITKEYLLSGGVRSWIFQRLYQHGEVEHNLSIEI